MISSALELDRENPGIGLLTPEEWTNVAQTLRFTPREWQVATLVFEGKTQDAIAVHLNIRPRTVRQHLERLYKKVEVHDRVGLVLRVVQVHLLLLEDEVT